MRMMEHSVSYYIGQLWRTTPLYREKLVPLLDYALSPNYIYADKLSNALAHVVDKYQNTSELPEAELRELVKESGYEYILDLLRPGETDLKVLVYLLVLIHQMKGSEAGIRLVLSLFQEEAYPEDTIITSWWNTIPVGEENTFDIETAIDIGRVGFGFYKNFKKFIQNYVYPELKNLKVLYGIECINTPIGFSRVKIKYKNKPILNE